MLYPGPGFYKLDKQQDLRGLAQIDVAQRLSPAQTIQVADLKVMLQKA